MTDPNASTPGQGDAVTGQNELDEATVEECVRQAVDDTYREERQLFNKKLPHERSIVFHIARRLADTVAEHGLVVDVEYDQAGDLANRTKKRRIEWHGTGNACGACTERDVYPDIIVHDRGPDGRNVLVIEVKKKGASADRHERDYKKLRFFLTDETYTYSHALFIVVSDDEPPTLEWICNERGLTQRPSREPREPCMHPDHAARPPSTPLSVPQAR